MRLPYMQLAEDNICTLAHWHTYSPTDEASNDAQITVKVDIEEKNWEYGRHPNFSLSSFSTFVLSTFLTTWKFCAINFCTMFTTVQLCNAHYALLSFHIYVCLQGFFVLSNAECSNAPMLHCYNATLLHCYTATML